MYLGNNFELTIAESNRCLLYWHNDYYITRQIKYFFYYCNTSFVLFLKKFPN